MEALQHEVPGILQRISIFHLVTMMAVFMQFRHEFLRIVREIDSKLTRARVVSTLYHY